MIHQRTLFFKVFTVLARSVCFSYVVLHCIQVRIVCLECDMDLSIYHKTTVEEKRCFTQLSMWIVPIFKFFMVAICL